MNATIKSKRRVLLLGGTTEARLLAERLAGDSRFDVTVSLAGRTHQPIRLPVPVRVGGFGGAGGLAAYLRAEHIELVVDATHPFAAIMSANAVAACEIAGVPLIALERPPWIEQPGDTWRTFDSVEAAVAALPASPVRVFSGLGRLSLDALLAAPQHHYVLRIIDPLRENLALPEATVLTARGPFTLDDDIELFKQHRIAIVLAKNSGGDAAVSKIDAARALGVPVHMIKQPAVPDRPCVQSVDAVLDWLEAHRAPPIERGV